MTLEGGCYCGDLRYRAEGEPMLRAQCHCRPCQHIAGGAPNLFMLMPSAGFAYTAGRPASFTRPDIDKAVTREFCGTCGTHIATHRPGLPAVVLKVGTLDDPSLFGQPQMAIFTAEKQPFHCIAEGLPAFEGLPPRR
ncbi:MAG: GFA family protein [Phreatobacter sp.]